ncbi:MAG: universal stress protein [Chloroflexota bacterium]|nr:universal stress protein [Chloroflexota bacterium]
MTRHKVVIPVNGSEFSRQIVDYVIEYLPAEDNEIVLLRVGQRQEGFVGRPARLAGPDTDVAMYDTSRDVTEAAHPIFATQVEQSTEAEFRREMRPVMNALLDNGYQVEWVVRFGNPGEQIVEYVENHDVDMVAMTTHSRGGLNRLIFGSVAEYVSHHVSVPIMMVRPVYT